LRFGVGGIAVCAVVFAAAPAGAAQGVPDRAAAEREYRLAQRLLADGSPDAAAAFERVVALDPEGPLVDDALVDLASALGSPEWPEDLGALDGAHAARVRVPLEKVVAAHSGGDRASEARYRLALVGMAPLPGRDSVSARQALIALSSNASRERWAAAARYARGFLDEHAGASQRAAGAFARVVVDQPETDVASRARAGLGRIALSEGRFGDAAGWLQSAIDGGVPPGVGAIAQRELAVREVLRERDTSRRWTSVASPLPVIATTRSASLLTTGADGRLVVFDRKASAIRAFDVKGAGASPRPLAEVTAMATDPYGRVFCATKDKIFRWDSTGLVAVSTLGDLGSASAIAVDAAGTIWLADRKGDRIVRWDPGAPSPVLVRESKGAGVAALVLAGGRVIAAEAKTGRLIVVEGSGAGTEFGAATFRRPVALTVDTALRISVLDDKAGTVTRLTPSGEVSDTLGLEAAGVSRPLALAAAPDGAVRILDGSTGTVAVTP
jgi:hypothetical protein